MNQEISPTTPDTPTASTEAPPGVYEGWIAVTFAIPGVDEEDPRIDALSSALFDLGAGGIETRDGGEQLEIIASFPSEAAPEVREAEALLALLELPPSSVKLSEYAAIDWSTHWRQHFQAIAFGAGEKRVDVVPTWLEPPEGAKHVLRLDPSSAFGTGLHATTAMCLERAIELAPVGSVLDVGTGTGIIALAVLRLGATRAVGTDIDPEALRVARENAERNGLGDALVLSGDEPSRVGEPFDLVVANILAQPLIGLASEIALATKPGGKAILSGITKTQVDDVVRAYETAGFTCTGVEGRDEWARVDLVRTHP